MSVAQRRQILTRQFFNSIKICLASIQICEEYRYSKFRSDAQRFGEMFMFATVDRLQNKGDKRYFS